jgi:hypothetical protein
MRNDKLIMVCSECLMACCWYGEIMCDDNKSAATIIKTVGELRKLKMEHLSYWSDKKLIEIYGEVPDFTKDYKKQVKDDNTLNIQK